MSLHKCPECGELIGSSTNCSGCGHWFEASEETEAPFGFSNEEKKDDS